jgi:hypothetical protein
MEARTLSIIRYYEEYNIGKWICFRLAFSSFLEYRRKDKVKKTQ